jgi:SEC-C motif-containing protein
MAEFILRCSVSNCPCGQPIVAEACCATLLSGHQSAETCERLMRARYTAYVQRNASFLIASWHPSTRPKTVPFDDLTHWIGLKVIKSRGGAADASGEVEFIATFKQQGKAYKMHERSAFIREQGQWFYLDGTIL